MAQVIIDQDPNKFSTSALQVAKNSSLNRLYGANENLPEQYNLHQKLLAEFIGTGLFVYGVCAAGDFYGELPAMAISGCACMGGVIIYIFGRVSGAHFNPAVSLGLFIRHKLTAMELGLYIVAQLLGGFLGCTLLGLVRRGKFKEMSGNQIASHLIGLGDEYKKTGWCYVSALIFEILGTFILLMFILASCERDNYLGPTLGLAFTVTLFAIIGIGGNVSSCSLNPARSFAPALIQVFASGDKTPIKQIWIYIVGPFLGAILAAFVWPVFVYAF